MVYSGASGAARSGSARKIAGSMKRFILNSILALAISKVTKSLLRSRRSARALRILFGQGGIIYFSAGEWDEAGFHRPHRCLAWSSRWHCRCRPDPQSDNRRGKGGLLQRLGCRREDAGEYAAAVVYSAL